MMNYGAPLHSSFIIPHSSFLGYHSLFNLGPKSCSMFLRRGRDVDMPGDTRVLVVENDVRLRNALAELIRSWGYEAESAPDGQQALEKISSFNPVLVVSDLRMPVM